MRHLALCWADGSAEDLQKFQFIFHISLKDVQEGKEIAELIIEQHKGLEGNKVTLSEINAIIQGQASQKVLILLDGHDEYQPGKNEAIDKTLHKLYLRNCWIIVTSRETMELDDIRSFADGEAKIMGFDTQSVPKYIRKYVGSRQLTMKLLDSVRKSNIIGEEEENEESDDEDYGETEDNDEENDGEMDDYDLEDDDFDYGYQKDQVDTAYFGILSIPILLHMVCFLFMRKVSLPKTKKQVS